jgi:hypothetical protein
MIRFSRALRTAALGFTLSVAPLAPFDAGTARVGKFDCGSQRALVIVVKLPFFDGHLQ